MGFGTLDYRSSFAVDKNNIDQTVSTDDFTEVNIERILWDLNKDLDLDDNVFHVPVDGLYFFDMQLRLENLTNVKRVEVALFKRDPNGIDPDDYWFVLADAQVNGADFLQMSGATSFDMYEGGEFILKLKLHKEDAGLSCSADIIGSDDLTAWGLKFEKGFLD